MKSLLLFIALTSLIIYFIYVLYWRTKSVSKTFLKKDEDKALQFLGRSVDWITFLLLAITIVAGILYKIL